MGAKQQFFSQFEKLKPLQCINLVLILFCHVLMATAQDNGAKSLKVLSYNIWNGFADEKGQDRRLKTIAWIKSQKADVVALQELCNYNKEKLLNDAREWGHQYAEILKTEGYPVGITSNKPISVKERILEKMHHGALHCQTWGIDFFVVHFSPFSHKKRHEEAAVVLAKLHEVRKRHDRYVVLGDFNALSPFDAQFYVRDKERIKEMKSTDDNYEHVQNLHLGSLEYGAMAKYIGFPLIDVVQKYTTELEERLSIPTQVWEERPNQGRYGHSERVDYIMVAPELAANCIYARVLNGENTYYLSDHYPVMAVFEF